MLVVASTSNSGLNIDMEQMMPTHKIGKSESWIPIFKRNCTCVVVTGDSWHSLASIRGALFVSSLSDEVLGEMDEIRVGKSGSELSRCPIHRVDKVCTHGNKTIVDLVVAIDPTGISRKECGWTFEVEFPPGFTPLCYTSKSSTLQYLAILFRGIGVMAVDITPVSYTLIWDIAEVCSVDFGENILHNQFHKLEVLNSTPGTKQNVIVRSERSDLYATVEVETPELNRENMCKFYLSRKRKVDADPKGGQCYLFDLEGVRTETVSYLRKNCILRSGQKVRMSTNNTTLSGEHSTRGPQTMSVAVSGDTISLQNGANNNIYVVPDFSVAGDSDHQFICLEDESHTSHVIEFDKSESYVKYKDVVYPHGTSFPIMVGQNNQLRSVAVVKGSIILRCEDFTPSIIPDGPAVALQVMSSGDLVIRDLVMRCSSQIIEKVNGDTTFGRNSFFVYFPDNGTTKECTRVSHGVNDMGDTGTMSVDLLYTDENSNEKVVNTFVSNPAQTSITSRDSSNDVVTATFNATGLSFDSDKGDIYFGADKDFRIHYEEESVATSDPAMLQIQSLSHGSYTTRFLITAEPP